MPHFFVRNGGTAVEAIGMVTTGDGAYYVNFAGPAEAAKAIWAGAVGSKKTGFVSSSWRQYEKLVKPNTRTAVKLPNSNYVHYVMRSTDPLFVLVTDPLMAQIRNFDGRIITPYGDKDKTKAYDDLMAIVQGWELKRGETTATSIDVAEWYADQPQFHAEMARKLVNALNQATKVPVLPEWGPTLLDQLPYSASVYAQCFGDAVNALMLRESFDWAEWIGKLLKAGTITIPNPEGE